MVTVNARNALSGLSRTWLKSKNPASADGAQGARGKVALTCRQ